jgi:starch synthase (maltosyl-transferring)
MIAYAKATRDLSNIIFSIVNLDPFHKQSGNVRIPLDKFGIAWGDRFEVEDLFTGHRYPWKEHNFIELDPHSEPIHLLRVIRGAS